MAFAAADDALRATPPRARHLRSNPPESANQRPDGVDRTATVVQIATRPRVGVQREPLLGDLFHRLLFGGRDDNRAATLCAVALTGQRGHPPIQFHQRLHQTLALNSGHGFGLRRATRKTLIWIVIRASPPARRLPASGATARLPRG